MSANGCISGGDTSSAQTGEYQYTKSETHSETGGYSDTYVFIAQGTNMYTYLKLDDIGFEKV
ncbi:hypothetical protein E3E23_07245 [Thermococcus sp. CX2]|uniref:hypothetical protein n=1 Tax=Thermococcus sp. CX2 TaxID=163006 RepID=UPI00143A7E60|nr:hypothetical protein [Thermococcus sp. CX2]NJE85616.1 hypothetical protein [Thermococcus sp. CX2]